MNPPGSPTKPILNTCAGQVRRPAPVWLMRQAGRYLPEYRALRAKASGFLDFCFRPELAVEATLQPIRRYGLDAAILFSDILTVPWALGQKVAFLEGEGPKLDPVRSVADLARLDPEHVVQRLQPVYDTVHGVADALSEETALIGFAGAPWTVAAYMVEGQGSRDFATAKSWGLADRAGFGRLLDILVAATVEHLSAQIRAGAELVQLFDSWAGALAEGEFVDWVIRPTAAIVEAVRRRHPGTRIIGFPRQAGSMLPRYVVQTGVDVVGLDTQQSVRWASETLPPGFPIQGNLDPIALLVGGDALRAGVRRILDEAAGRPLIFNLGHGVLQPTPPEHVAELVALVRQA